VKDERYIGRKKSGKIRRGKEINAICILILIVIIHIA
jgi:hypothetical protein